MQKKFTSEHAMEMLSSLNRERMQRSSEKYCDVTLIVKGFELPCHRCVLRSFSPFFRDLFNSETRNADGSKFEIQRVDKESMETILNFIYTCDVTITNENVYSLCKASILTKISYLTECCISFLVDGIGKKNCFTIRKFAKRCNLGEPLINKANGIIAQNFDYFVGKNRLKDLQFDDMLDLFSKEKSQIRSAESAFHALMSWVKYDVDLRRQHVAQLFSLINLEDLSWNFMRNVVKTEALIMNSYECNKLVLKQTAYFRNEKEQESKHLCVAFWSKKVLRYNAITNQVTRLPDSMFDHFNGSGVSYNQVVFAMSGRSRTVEQFDLEEQSSGWVQSADTNVRRCQAASVVYDDFIFSVGGIDWNALSAAEKYCFVDKKWSPISDMIKGRSQFALVTTRGLLYSIGGYDTAGIHSSAECYNPETDTWEMIPSMNIERRYLAAVVLYGLIYAIGGCNYGGKLKSVERYDPFQKKWHFVTDLQEARFDHGACVLNGKIYVFGGGTDMVEMYDPEKNMWTTRATIPFMKEVQFVVTI